MRVLFHTLRQEQWIPRPIHEVFAFFADACNLEAITPPWLKFKILSPTDAPVAAGTVIRYRLRWHGMPIRWTTQIRSWDAPRRFVDVQTAGPYRLWHHTHRFEAYGDQTRMVDVVRYALPLGFLGRIAYAAKVRADVRRIFEYRRDRIAKLFSAARSAAK